jgi:hypothetical protein
VGACLQAKNKRRIKDKEAVNLVCEGTIRVENVGFGCTRMVVVRLRCKCVS